MAEFSFSIQPLAEFPLLLVQFLHSFYTREFSQWLNSIQPFSHMAEFLHQDSKRAGTTSNSAILHLLAVLNVYVAPVPNGVGMDVFRSISLEYRYLFRT